MAVLPHRHFETHGQPWMVRSAADNQEDVTVTVRPTKAQFAAELVVMCHKQCADDMYTERPTGLTLTDRVDISL